MKILEKFLTREAPLIAVESWYDGIVKYTEEFFGMPFPENLLIFKNGTVECYRDSKRNMIELPVELALWAKSNKDKIKLTYQKLESVLNLFKRIKINRETSIKELIKYLQDTRKALVDGFPGLVTTYLFQLWQDAFIKKDKQLFDKKLIEEGKYWRERTGEFFDKSIDMIYSLLKEIATRKNWDFASLKYITYQELIKSIKEKKSLPLDIIQKRQGSVFAYINGKILYEPDIDKSLKAHGYQIKKEAKKDINELRGAIANKGKIKGRIKIVLNRSELNKVGNDDILVAPMTTPWYLPAMKKAAGFITDEGGLLCHAAIVSREMNKPCIIGAKIATKVLKDGDLVEVDANKGIVRRIK